MIRSKISNMEYGSTSRPVSSSTSRRIPSASFSPVSTMPPGMDQKPFSGSLPRSTSKILPSSKINAPTPRNGREGYRRSASLICKASGLIRTPLHVQAHAIERSPRRDVQRPEIRIAESAIGRCLFELDVAERLSLGGERFHLFGRHVQIALLVDADPVRHAF